MTFIHDWISLAIQQICTILYIITKSNDKTISLAGISTLRQFLCSEDPPIQAVLDSGVIPDLIQILVISDNAPIPDVIWYDGHN